MNSINKLILIFKDLSSRHKLLNDFYYGQPDDLGASERLKFPYLWVEQGSSEIVKSLNGFKETIYSFNFYVMDKINKGDDNYDEIVSDTHFILDGIIQELAQHKYYVDMNISIDGNIVMDPVVEATDDNVNGWQAAIRLKVPIRYTPCNTPIEPIVPIIDNGINWNNYYENISATGSIVGDGLSKTTVSINKIISIFNDLSLRHKMLNDFYYGQSWNFNAQVDLKYPVLWVEQGSSEVVKSINGYKENIYNFDLYVMDKINMGDDNYDEIISDTHFILDTIISDISGHRFYIDMNISLIDNIVMEPVVEATDNNVNGWRASIRLKVPIKYTPCNTPIEPINNYIIDYGKS